MVFCGPGPLQALVVQDYKLNIDTRTAADVSLGRGREAVSAPPLPSVLLHSADYSDLINIMTLGNWNGQGSNGVLRGGAACFSAGRGVHPCLKTLR